MMMMRTISASIPVAALLALATVAPPRKQAPSPEAVAAVLRRAPASASSWKNPSAGDTEAVLAGRKLFLHHCAQCHGGDGRGQGKAPDLHSAAIQHAPPGVLFWFLRNGNLRSGMPSWSALPDPQRWQIVSYLQAVR